MWAQAVSAWEIEKAVSGRGPVRASQLEKAKVREQASVLSLVPALGLNPLPALALAMMLLSHPLEPEPSFASSLKLPEGPTASRPSPD